ncbi:hypothetical protein BDV96DRAFT_642637 [Lophiotrema nucula]|uniref:Uncharacterized protein n=1 Tax=Lophiotrema nucula TaxID=690887 RepID=A0A6A5ZN34_9PLEO|nr:hypothetical protein BDV96DRAFT_642637 [Lophiotrema nucula]
MSWIGQVPRVQYHPFEDGLVNQINEDPPVQPANTAAGDFVSARRHLNSITYQVKADYSGLPENNSEVLDRVQEVAEALASTSNVRDAAMFPTFRAKFLPAPHGLYTPTDYFAVAFTVVKEAYRIQRYGATSLIFKDTVNVAQPADYDATFRARLGQFNQCVRNFKKTADNVMRMAYHQEYLVTPFNLFLLLSDEVRDFNARQGEGAAQPSNHPHPSHPYFFDPNDG